VNQWNEGKVEEFKQRKTFKIAQGTPEVKEAQVVPREAPLTS
jgi:hypothetical protein